MNNHLVGIVVDLRGETCRQVLVNLCRMDLDNYALTDTDLQWEIEHAWTHEPDMQFQSDPEYDDWLDAVQNSPDI